MISVEDFFNLLLKEIEANPNLKATYKFLDDPRPAVFNFRKRYFCQRLSYIQKSIVKKDALIWDCGCGFGTTAIFLTLNGYKVFGNTLEFFYDQLASRMTYWSQYGDLSKLNIVYQDHFDLKSKEKFDYVIAQDTLHHLEPVNNAINIISEALVKGGKLIAIEENGKSFINRFKNFIKRGNKLVIELYDEKLKRTFLLGNENLRTAQHWQKLLAESNVNVDKKSVEYIRIYTPFFYRFISLQTVERRELSLWKTNPFIRDFFYFGVNFTATKE